MRSDRGRLQALAGAAALIVLASAAMLALLGRQPPPGRPGGGPAGFEVVRVLDGPGRGSHPRFRRPLSAAWGPDAAAYVADTGNQRICVFDPSGRFVREFGGAAASGKPRAGSGLQQPCGVAVGSDGTVYVADVAGHAVFAYTAEGVLVRRLAPPEASGWRPVDVATDGRVVYVADQTGVARFLASTGEYVGRLELPIGMVGLDRPAGVAVRPDGGVVVADSNGRRLISLDASGAVTWVVDADAPGALGLPRGVDVGPDGEVVVADAFLFRIAVFDEKGSLSASFGSRGEAPGFFSYPNDVAISGDHLLVTDKGNDRVQVLRRR